MDGSEGTRSYVDSDLDYALAVESRLSSGWRLCGHMHSHWFGSLEPSDQDLVMWRNLATEFRRPFAGVIVGPGNGTIPFAYPERRAWIVDQNGVDRPAALSVEN